MLYKRKLIDKINKYFGDKEMVVITGPRRAGKTTLMEMIFDQVPGENKIFLDIENPIEQKIFEEENYNNIWNNLISYKDSLSKKERCYVFLDEIQSYPEIIKPVKYLYDHYNIKFFLTGSSSFYLKNLFPESLAGRKVIFELFPLDFEEFLVFKEKKKPFYGKISEVEKNKNKTGFEKYKKLYEEYLEFGGYPKIVLAETAEKKREFLDDIFKSYFEKDVKIISDFKNINVFRDLILLLMQRVGSKLDISKLASETGVSRDSIYSYLAFLQATYFIHLVSPFTKSIDREVSSLKKVYFSDTGLVNRLSRQNEGSIFENSVFLNLRKYGNISYYQTKSGAEIDFVINKKIAIEAKTGGIERDYKKLTDNAKKLNIRNYYIASKKFSEQIGFVPAQDF